MNSNDLIRKLRATGRFVFAYKLTDEEKELPISQQKARLRINFEKNMSSFFNEAYIEPVANYRNEVERL